MSQGESESVYVVGTNATPVGRYTERSFTELVREALLGALGDARLSDPDRIEGTWFSNTFMDFWGQRSVRGQAVLLPLMQEGVFPRGQQIVNVEDACASGSVAFNGAYSAIRAGADLSLAIGVEKMHDATRTGTEFLQWMDGAGNALNPERYWEPYRKLTAELGMSFELEPGRSIGMDVYAVLAASHMRQYGTTVEQIAAAAAKNHTNAVHNPRAQYRFPMTVDEVLGGR